MIYNVEKGTYWMEERANIIFNPVSVSETFTGLNMFNSGIKDRYRNVYESYRDYMVGVSKRKLLGDIQLVQIEDKRLVMNAFVYEGNILNVKALAKVLVELVNLAEEYKISVVINTKLNSKNKDQEKISNKVIKSVFGDCKSDIYIYTN